MDSKELDFFKKYEEAEAHFARKRGKKPLDGNIRHLHDMACFMPFIIAIAYVIMAVLVIVLCRINILSLEVATISISAIVLICLSHSSYDRTSRTVGLFNKNKSVLSDLFISYLNLDSDTIEHGNIKQSDHLITLYPFLKDKEMIRKGHKESEAIEKFLLAIINQGKISLLAKINHELRHSNK